MNFETALDKTVAEDLEHFFIKVNERACIQQGWAENNYQPLNKNGEGIKALGYDVEYFHPVITMDDRMRYICENIVSLDNEDISMDNKICNTIISHFYGARGIHSTLTGISDPKKAHIDFERIATGDVKYTNELQELAEYTKDKKIPVWGTTELHTSIQTAGRNFCRGKYDNQERKMRVFDVAEWVANFINDGTCLGLREAKNLKDAFKILTKHKGIGDYYGYHCSTSNSVNPKLNFDNDDMFCKPGPGATISLRKLFPNISNKELGDGVVWLRENQTKLFPNLQFHDNMKNIVVYGKSIFQDDQDELKVYGTEVGICQFSVFCHLQNNPHLAAKRTVARSEDDSVCDAATEDFFSF